MSGWALVAVLAVIWAVLGAAFTWCVRRLNDAAKKARRTGGDPG